MFALREIVAIELTVTVTSPAGSNAGRVNSVAIRA
jgi:hypothetical protein